MILFNSLLNGNYSSNHSGVCLEEAGGLGREWAAQVFSFCDAHLGLDKVRRALVCWFVHVRGQEMMGVAGGSAGWIRWRTWTLQHWRTSARQRQGSMPLLLLPTRRAVMLTARQPSAHQSALAPRKQGRWQHPPRSLPRLGLCTLRAGRPPVSGLPAHAVAAPPCLPACLHVPPLPPSISCACVSPSIARSMQTNCLQPVPWACVLPSVL